MKLCGKSVEWGVSVVVGGGGGSGGGGRLVPSRALSCPLVPCCALLCPVVPCCLCAVYLLNTNTIISVSFFTFHRTTTYVCFQGEILGQRTLVALHYYGSNTHLR